MAEFSRGVPVRGPLAARLRAMARDDTGMSTAEYAIGTIAAAAFGALLYTVVTTYRCAG